MMRFYVLVQYQGKEYCLRVETNKLTREIAEYKVSGKNRSITLQTNAPFGRAKAFVPTPASWKVVDGIPPQKEFLEAIIESLEQFNELN